MCQGKKSCRACSNAISGMKKKTLKKNDLFGIGVENLKSAGFTLAGYGLAEALGNVAANNISQLSSPNARIAVKSVGSIATAVAAVRSKQYQKEGLLLAAGMGTNAVKDVVGKFLPNSVTQYLPPSVNGIPLRISQRANARNNAGGAGNAQYTEAGIAA